MDNFRLCSNINFPSQCPNNHGKYVLADVLRSCKIWNRTSVIRHQSEQVHRFHRLRIFPVVDFWIGKLNNLDDYCKNVLLNG